MMMCKVPGVSLSFFIRTEVRLKRYNVKYTQWEDKRQHLTVLYLQFGIITGAATENKVRNRRIRSAQSVNSPPTGL